MNRTPRFFLLVILACSHFSAAGPWDGATHYDGWLGVDWFGFLYPVDEYMLHAEHGWQYPYGTTPESVHLFDYATRSWAWTGRGVYPWLYWFGDLEDWVFYYRGGSPGRRWFYAHTSRVYLPEEAMRPAVFVAGSFTVYPVLNAGPNPFIVDDSTTGLVLSVPGGQNGELKIARLKSAPPAPYPGLGVVIDRDSLEGVSLVIPASRLAPGDLPLVFVHGVMQGAFDDAIGYARRWVGLPREDLPDGGFRFHLPEESAGGTLQGRHLKTTGFERALPSAPRHFWVSKIDASMPEAQQHTHIRLQVATYVGDLMEELNVTLRTITEARRLERLLTIGYGGNYYCGFNKLRAWGLGRRAMPTLHITSPAETQSLAHETGHYITHLLVGDEAYDTLEKAGGSLFAGNHGIRDPIGRENLLEDYAYLIESFLIETGGNYDLTSPYSVFTGLSPRDRDFPGLEGFAACMMAGLRQSAVSMRNRHGIFEPIHPMNVTWGRILAVLAEGSLSVDALREQLERALNPVERQAFQVILQRMGWNYRIQGRLIDADGHPVRDAVLRNFVRIGEERYEGGFTSVPSKEDGSFTIVGDVFGGHSLLEIIQAGGLTVVVPLRIDWSHPTPTLLDVGDLIVAERQLLTDTFSTEYKYNGWPPNFSLILSGSVLAQITTPEGKSAQILHFAPHQYAGSSPKVTFRLDVPAGSVVDLSGSLTIAPSAMEGTYLDGFNYETKWNIKDWTGTLDNAYPAGAFQCQVSAQELTFTGRVSGTGQALVAFKVYATFEQRHFDIHGSVWAAILFVD